MIEIRLLLPGDDRASFSSGNEPLDRYFRQYAGQNQFRHRIGANYVALEEGRIVGFATVSPAQIEAEPVAATLTRRLPAYPVPVLRLARLATHSDARGRGIGAALLRYVFTLALRMGRDFGCAGVVVDAKADATAFYQRYGFKLLETAESAAPGSPQPMFLPLASIASEQPHAQPL